MSKDQALPKKKFGFKRKKENMAEEKGAKPEEKKVQNMFDCIDTNLHLSIKDINGQTLVINESDYIGKENLIISNV